MHRVRLAPDLRSERVYRAIVAQLARVKTKDVRVVHYSVQRDHMHLIVEATDRHDLSSQMRTLFSRIALAVNGVAKRRGSIFRDRHHRRDLKGPTEVRNALVYVLFNERKHATANGGEVSARTLAWLDERSSIAWLDDWDERARPPPAEIARLRLLNVDAETGEAPVSAPRTWLAKTGWFARGGGRMRVYEMPRFA